uniref:Prefoldin subunit 2 n=1 Tax=Syphacia muris TaxID=451379 RepID=A0A0N5ARP6_9BILA
MSALNAKELSEKQEVLEKFQRLREQQQEIASQMHSIDEDRREHKRVLEVLKEMEATRKCYRLVGESTLVEYKVGDVLDILGGSLMNLNKGYDVMQEQLVSKGKELNEFREKNNIRIVTEKEALELGQAGDTTSSK